MTNPHDAAAPDAVIRILIADDHEVVRIGLAALLDAQDGFSVVAQAGSGEDATRLARQHHPDVVVMDIRMPNGSGIDACRTITRELEGTPVIMLTSHADSEALFDAIDAGASGYVLKRVGSGDLVDAVRTVAAGGSLLDPGVTRRVLDRIRNASRCRVCIVRASPSGFARSRARCHGSSFCSSHSRSRRYIRAISRNAALATRG